jgi:hypothetical protein
MQSQPNNFLALRQDFFNEGYCILPAPAPDEQQWLYNFVQSKWLNLLIADYPGIQDAARKMGLTNYHKIADKIDHQNFWTKDRRLFLRHEIGILTQNLSVFNHLNNVFGDFKVEDIEGIGHSEIYWRLVRPNALSDVAVAHKDSWFFSITNNMSETDQEGLIKVWLPVVSEIGSSGLSVCPGSHKLVIPHTSEVRHGRPKPDADPEVLKKYSMKSLPLSVGQAVAFDKELLHKGISHDNDFTRVSIEFAIRLN